MNKNRVWLATFLTLYSPPAFAAPVSLECYLTDAQNGQKQTFEIQLNEETESASYPHPFNPNEVVRYRAYFTPSKVAFGDGIFSIDRTTLAFSRRKTFGSRDLGTDYGKCVVSSVKRAF